MKQIFSFLVISFLSVLGLMAQPKTYTVPFEENIPYGVSAWSQSDRVKKSINKESRFGPYRRGAAEELVADALVDRGGEAVVAVEERETAFWQAYNDKGWYIYIESKEPLVEDLVNKLIDPRSAGHKESYEIFFAPGLKEVPYYQIFINTYQNKATFYDWGMPHTNYRSLKNDTRVESLPLDDGVGTFIFIPWYLLYEKLPLEGDDWRFTIIRWMPFAKAGGLTWGGGVHETGNFGIVRFERPTVTQRKAIEDRILQYAWYKFQAISDQQKEYWSDPHIGDSEFYEKVLAPEIERLTTAGQRPENLKTLMEFDYKVSELRTRYLEQKIFSQN